MTAERRSPWRDMSPEEWDHAAGNARVTESEDALREALRSRNWYIADVVTAKWIESSDWAPVVAAALAARPSQPALDVDRLARALHQQSDNCYHVPGDSKGECMWTAEAIAAEYEKD